MKRAVVDFIPLVWCEPANGTQPKVAIWLPGFGGTKESCEPQLRELADAGFIALSFDPFQHGERRVESQGELGARVAGNIRRHFWPILAQSALDTLRVIDWAQQQFGAESVAMGGVSMGGDISVAAAGMDARIERVAACLATPDWLRPGSFEPPGEADALAQWFYDKCNPLTNLKGYARCPAITFECGAEDGQVPPDGAARFVEALGATYADCPDRLRVTLHPGVGHSFTPRMWQNAKEWLTS